MKTNRELKKLNRIELLELLLAQSKEIDRLNQEITRLNGELEKQKALQQETEKRLEDRRLRLEETGSMAEAALSVFHVLEDAQKAADLYLENVRQKAEDLYPENGSPKAVDLNPENGSPKAADLNLEKGRPKAADLNPEKGRPRAADLNPENDRPRADAYADGQINAAKMKAPSSSLHLCKKIAAQMGTRLRRVQKAKREGTR